MTDKNSLIDEFATLDPFVQYCMLNRGEATRIAKELGLSKATISNWKKVPTDLLPQVSSLTGIPIKVLDPRFDQDKIS